jgi:3'(2'), 5'-bisphosphate nucleotidase
MSCATLLIDGVEMVAAFGCPHVNLESGRISEQDTDTTGNGYLISAVRGKGAQVRPLSRDALLESRTIEKNKTIHDLSKIRFAENCITTSPQFPDRYKIAEKLGAPWNPITMAVKDQLVHSRFSVPEANCVIIICCRRKHPPI